MKKIFVNIIIFIVLINVVLSNFSYVRAETDTTTYDQYMNEGTATVYPDGDESKATSMSTENTDSVFDTILDILLTIINVVPTLANGMLTLIVSTQNMDWDASNVFTIQSLVFGDYDLFDINIFNEKQVNLNGTIKAGISGWYNATRSIAIIVGLCVLIYVGIRMAMSTVAQDKAKYKKMLVDWLTSFILIFVLHYIIIIAISLSQNIITLLPKPADSLEVTIMNKWGINAIGAAKGGQKLETSILFWMMVWYQVKFFLLYMKRLLSTMFLVIIAPLITITYSIDKIGDNKAQALGAWTKEIIVNIFIQPLHAIVYLVFIASAGAIAEAAPFVAIIMFFSLARVEKIVKNIFDLRGMSSIRSVGSMLKKG